MIETTITASDQRDFETLISGLIDAGVGVCDAFLDAAILQGLRDNLFGYHAAGAMHSAGVGKNFDYVKNTEIRGDVIRWIEEDSADPHEQRFFTKVKRFIHHLNATCYTGIDACEFHYAYYAEGSFYKRHLDRFRQDKGRQFSFILYLNDDWRAEHNGRISLYLPAGERVLSPRRGGWFSFAAIAPNTKYTPPSAGPASVSRAG